MQTINLPLNALRAALTHTPEKDVRYYLLGVYIDTKSGHIVATDGHRMVVCDGPKASCEPFIIGRDDLTRALKSFPSEYGRGKTLATADVSVTVQTTDGKTWITVEGYNGAKFTFPAVDGKFPDYQRVIPQTVKPIEFATFNSDYVTDAFDAIALYRNVPAKKAAQHGAGLMMQGNSPAIVADSDPGIIVIVMPMRSNTDGSKFVDALIWAHGQSTESIRAAA